MEMLRLAHPGASLPDTIRGPLEMVHLATEKGTDVLLSCLEVGDITRAKFLDTMQTVRSQIADLSRAAFTKTAVDCRAEVVDLIGSWLAEIDRLVVAIAPDEVSP